MAIEPLGSSALLVDMCHNGVREQKALSLFPECWCIIASNTTLLLPHLVAASGTMLLYHERLRPLKLWAKGNCPSSWFGMYLIASMRNITDIERKHWEGRSLLRYLHCVLPRLWNWFVGRMWKNLEVIKKNPRQQSTELNRTCWHKDEIPDAEKKMYYK